MLLRQRHKHGSDIRCSGWVSMSSSVYGTRIRDIKMTLKYIMCCMHNCYYHFRFPRTTLPTGGLPSSSTKVNCPATVPQKGDTFKTNPRQHTFTRQTRVTGVKLMIVTVNYGHPKMSDMKLAKNLFCRLN